MVCINGLRMSLLCFRNMVEDTEDNNSIIQTANLVATILESNPAEFSEVKTDM